MLFNVSELDNLIFGILDDCKDVEPPLDRHEISRHVVDHLTDTVNEHVFASLDRLARSGRVYTDAIQGAADPIRYWLARAPARN